MKGDFRLTLAQLNPTLGDFAGNRAKALAAHREGAAAGADFVALPELFLTGCPPRDLVLKPGFVADAMSHAGELARETADGPPLGIGLPMRVGDQVFNAYAMLRDGGVAGFAKKHHLPSHNVFDEPRVFNPGEISGPFGIGPLRIGTPIHEDAWYPDVTETMAETGADILMVPNGSAFRRGESDVRMMHMVNRVVETGLPLVYLNMLGGQDDQVFEGGSFVLNPGGGLAAQLPCFEEAVAHIDFDRTPEGWRARPGRLEPVPGAVEEDYAAMVMGLRDYVRKSGFAKVLVGLSGGADSALVAAIATDALGSAAVRCVTLPSEHTSRESLEDAKAVAAALGCRLDTVPIEMGWTAVMETLAPLLYGRAADATQETTRSRLRCLMLMALSDTFGEMLLAAVDKSQAAVGRVTIHGDMNGGYNPIKDLYRTRVLETCHWRDRHHRSWMLGPRGVVIPPRVIENPSAEPRPEQTDADDLPYEVLDGILEMLIEGDCSIAEVTAAGYDRATVARVERLVRLSEYKRSHSAPGPRLTRKAFGLDRRYPIVNRWRDPS